MQVMASFFCFLTAHAAVLYVQVQLSQAQVQATLSYFADNSRS